VYRDLNTLLDKTILVKQMRLTYIKVFNVTYNIFTLFHWYMFFPDRSGFYISRFYTPFEWIDKSEKCKEPFHQSIMIQYEGRKMVAAINCGTFPFNQRKLKLKQSCHCMFRDSEKIVLLFGVRILFLSSVWNKLLCFLNATSKTQLSWQM